MQQGRGQRGACLPVAHQRRGMHQPSDTVSNAPVCSLVTRATAPPWRPVLSALECAGPPTLPALPAAPAPPLLVAASAPAAAAPAPHAVPRQVQRPCAPSPRAHPAASSAPSASTQAAAALRRRRSARFKGAPRGLQPQQSATTKVTTAAAARQGSALLCCSVSLDLQCSLCVRRESAGRLTNSMWSYPSILVPAQITQPFLLHSPPQKQLLGAQHLTGSLTAACHTRTQV